MRFLDRGSFLPECPTIREDLQSKRQDSPRCTDLTPLLRGLCITHPSVQPIFFFDIHSHRRLDDRFASTRRTLLLAFFRLLEPLIARQQYLMSTKLPYTRFDSFVNSLQFLVPLRFSLAFGTGLLFEQPACCNPNFVGGRNGLSSFVEYRLRLFRCLQSSKSKP